MEGSRFSQTSISSPIKNVNISHLEQDKKTILKRLHYLFVMYAGRASRYVYKQINEKYFMEMMVDTHQIKFVRLIKNSDAWKKIATLYHSKGKKTGMDYESFLKLLPSISQLFCRGQSEEMELKSLLQHLMAVYDRKIAKEIEGKYVQFETRFKTDTVLYIEKLCQNLFTIYKVYFPQEMTNITLHSETPIVDTFDRLVTFFKEFQVYPKIISASQLYLIFLEIMTKVTQNPFSFIQSRHKKSNLANTFDFAKFIEILVRVSVVSIARLRQIEDPEQWVGKQKECLKALFEYMESAKNKSKNCKYQNIRFSFIVYEEYTNEKQKWYMVGSDTPTKGTANKKDFFDMFEKMKL